MWRVAGIVRGVSAMPCRRGLRLPHPAWPALPLLLALTGCGVWWPVSVPMASLSEPARCATPADTLLVMLPGSFARPEEFMREGFVQAVRERRLAVDMVLVDAHLGYYSDRSIIDRLQADIVALGPYLGKRSVTEQVRAAGGLARWQAPGGVLAADEIDLILWRWLQGARADGGAAPAPLYLGYGLADRFRADDELLAAALPAERVITAPGGHDWPVWLTLWQRMLDVLPLRRDATCALPAAL